MPAAALPALTFSVALPPALMDVGVKEALAPLGVPDTARLIVGRAPVCTAVMVLDRMLPCARLRLLGLAEIVKFGLGAVTLSCTLFPYATLFRSPVTVSV